MSDHEHTPEIGKLRQAHWDTVAERFRVISPPLRPCEVDIDVIRREAHHYAGEHGATELRCALLGVTPEIASLDWPDGTRLWAIEHSTSMIRRNWPGNVAGKRHVFCANWLHLPLAANAYDIIVADGSLNSLDYPDDYHTLASLVHQALKPRGLFITRCFVQTAQRESTDAVFDELLANRIGNFHIFKFRLAMAMQADGAPGVRLDDIWSAWHNAGIAAPDLAERTGWPVAAIETIDLYRSKHTRLSFPTLSDAQALLSQRFDLLECAVPDYEMGDRCPTFVLRRR